MNFTYEGRTLPARVTMGALRRFKAETGKDMVVAQTKGDVTADDLAVLLWAAIVTQCRVEGVEFGVPLDDFLDRVTPDEVARWHVAGTHGDTDEPGQEDSKKKKPTPRPSASTS